MSGKVENIKRQREKCEEGEESSSKRVLPNEQTSANLSDQFNQEQKQKNNTEDSKENNTKEDLLKAALDKLAELENELASYGDNDEGDSTDSGHDDEDEEAYNQQVALAHESESLGFAVCARETLSYLMSAGLSPNDPLIRSLRSRLVGRCHGIPI